FDNFQSTTARDYIAFKGGIPMRWNRVSIAILCLFIAAFWGSRTGQQAAVENHLLYVASPGIRNYVQYGGVGILVYDIDQGHKFVKRIPTWPEDGKPAENVKGIAANAKTARIYVSTPRRLACFDLITEKKVWEKEYDGGSDRMALTPDGKTLYVPSLEGPH